ncbi:MAG: 30S ribosomal protein S1 [Planctomycetota bacterium]
MLEAEKYMVSEDQVEREVAEIFEPFAGADVSQFYQTSLGAFEVGSVIKGKILDLSDKDVLVDIGYKSAGVISREDFPPEEEIKLGDEVEVALESVENEAGMVVLSRRKALRVRGWEKVVSEKREGDTVEGIVVRKIKGGLLVDIGGVTVFLPASQAGAKRMMDVGELLGQKIVCKIIKIDVPKKNIVVSRRQLLEEQRSKDKTRLLTELRVGEMRRGVVKNLADFGAFIDLGGIDGLLHITDMSWGRIGHPSEKLGIDEEVEVVILAVDKEKERVSLGLKQKTASPWESVEGKFTAGMKIKGTVVSIMNYGCFVRIEDGIEGLVHISEMSWTKRVNHPSELVAVGETMDVVVLGINKEKREISLGMKQVESNPWEKIQEKYPVGTKLKGQVRALTDYGAFIELEENIDGLLHVSDMSWTKKVAHPGEVVKKGDELEVVVLAVDPEKKRVAIGVKQLTEDPWVKVIPEKYKEGSVVTGKVTKVAGFGVFVELEKDLEGLLHISELSAERVGKPEDVVAVGQDVTVKVIRLEMEERKIGLSLKGVAGEAKA